MDKKLSKNILATIIYYDGLAYPLTVFEVWKYLMRSDYSSSESQKMQHCLTDVAKELSSDFLFKYLESKNGFYFLKNRSALVEKRISANRISAQKLRLLRKSVFWLRLIPFVKMVGVTGALAMKNAKPSSDWDVLIVLTRGRIWIGRTLVTGLTFIFGKWRHGRKITDRICLNCFITDKSLEVITKDVFSASEYMFMFPLFGWETYSRFQIKNKWIAPMRPSYALAEIAPLKLIVDNIFSKKVRMAGEKLLSLNKLERWLRKIEKKRIMKNPKTHQEGSLIYAGDDALLFFPNPHGPQVFEKFKEKIESLSL